MIPKPKYTPVKTIYGGTFDLILDRISNKLHAGETIIEVKKWISNTANRLEPREHRQILIDACNHWAQLIAVGLPVAVSPEQLKI